MKSNILLSILFLSSIVSGLKKTLPRRDYFGNGKLSSEKKSQENEEKVLEREEEEGPIELSDTNQRKGTGHFSTISA